MEIVILSKERCPACKAVKKSFAKYDVPITEYDVNEAPELLAIATEAGISSAPVVFIDDEIMFSGFRPDSIKAIVEMYKENL